MKTPNEIKKGLECCAPVNDDGVCAGDDGLCSDCPYNGTEHCGDKLKRDAFELINQLESAQPKWISVDDKLPDGFKTVIVCREIKKGTLKVEQGYRNSNGWWRLYGSGLKRVTHWIELPKPPKEECNNG